MDVLKQIKYNRLKFELIKFLGSLIYADYGNHSHVFISYIDDTDGRSGINIRHEFKQISVNPSIVKSDLPKDIILEIVKEFTQYRKYKIEWMY